jgi:hypothetical protein
MDKDVADRAKARTDLVITNNIATWEMRVDGDYSGTFMGTFKFRCYLSPLQRIAAGREMRDLLGPIAGLANKQESFMAFAITELKYRVLEAPPFWGAASAQGYAGDLHDENVVFAVFDAAIDAENKYKAILQDKRESAIMRAKEAAEKILNERDAKKKDPIEEEIDEEPS